MSRTLRRPMFRRGGSANDGIMSGLEDREKLFQGTPNPAAVGQSARDYIEQFEPLLREFTPKTRLPLGAVGAALVGGTPIKEALAGGYSQFVKRDDAREAAIRGGAAKLGISQAMAEAKPSTNILKNRRTARINLEAKLGRGNFTEEDVEFADRDQLQSLIDTIIQNLEKLKQSFNYGNPHSAGEEREPRRNVTPFE